MVEFPGTANAASSSAIPARISGLSIFSPNNFGRAGHDNTMRVAQDNLRAHGDQLIGEIHPARIHPVMEQDTATRLCSHRDGNADQVGGKGRPDIGFDFRDGIAQVGLDLQALLRRHNDVLAIHFPIHPQPVENDADHIQVLEPALRMHGSRRGSPRLHRQN